MIVIARWCFLLVVASVFFSGSVWADEDEKRAIQVAEWFLFEVDEGRCLEAWESTSTLFRLKTYRRSDWLQLCREVRPLFGPVLKRHVKMTRYRESLPGRPDGDYLIIVFESVLGRKSTAIETVTTKYGADGLWRIDGYVLR